MYTGSRTFKFRKVVQQQI